MVNLSDKNTKSIIVAVVFAAVVISGALVFVGTRMNGSQVSDDALQDKVFTGIDAYIKKEQQKQADAQTEAEKPKFVTGDFSDDDPILGDKNAPVTIVEFSDYQCPYCGSFRDQTLPQIQKEYIDTGKAKLIYRDFPLSFHPYAYPAALFGECVDDLSNDETYFKVHDELFRTVQNGKFDYDAMSKFAAGLGVDKTALKTCFDNDKFKNEIEADQQDGQKAGVSGTPGFIINGQVLAGAQPFSKFKEIIDGELEKKPK